MTKRQKRIVNAWDMFEAMEPDISTERLFAMVECETGADAGDIAAALFARQAGEEKRNEHAM